MDHNPIAIRVFDAAAKAYQDAFMETALYHDSFDLFCAAIAPLNADVLELGCGPGNITHYLLKKRPDFRILGTDLSPNMLALALASNPASSFQLLDARKIRSLDRSFDGIMCGFCLPYLSPAETTALIRDAAAMLRSNGILYLSTMEDDPDKSGFKAQSSGKGEAAFTYYYRAGYLTDVLHANGFTLLDVSRKVYSGRDGKTVTDLLIIAST